MNLTLNDLTTLLFLIIGVIMFFKAIFGDTYSKDPVSHSTSNFVYGMICFGIAIYAQLSKIAGQ